MAQTTDIEWCDATWSPWEGCTKVSPGCDNCYAAARNGRFSKGANWGAGSPRRYTKDWSKPYAWDRLARAIGDRRRVFPSLCDPFDNEVNAEWRAEFFAMMAMTPGLDWLLLTKRIGNARSMVDQAVDDVRSCFAAPEWPWPNVWLGATVVNQEEADRDIPKLLSTPAAVRFLSIEPMLGPIDLTCEWLTAKLGSYPFKGLPREHRTTLLDLLEWVICGGESGPHARPMHPDWPRSLRDQCRSSGVPFFFKQWGEWLPWTQFSDAAIADPPEQTRFATCEYSDGEWRDVGRPGWQDTMDGAVDDEQCVGRVGIKRAGSKLDGREHKAWPGFGRQLRLAREESAA